MQNKPFFTPAPNPRQMALGQSQSLFTVTHVKPMRAVAPEKKVNIAKAQRTTPVVATISVDKAATNGSGVDFKTKRKLVGGILAGKKASGIVAPIIAACTWNGIDINEPIVYNHPTAIVQQAKVSGRDMICPDFQNNPELKKGDLVCNSIFGT